MNSNSNRIFRFVRLLIAASFAAIGLANICLAGPSQILYDVDFDGPPHVVGATPAFGFGPFPRNTPTSGGEIFPTGSATVVASFGPLTNRPVKLKVLDGTPNDPGKLGGTDLQFDLTDPSLAAIDRFHASVDVVPSQLRTASGLGIFFDAPSIHSVQFWPDGNIRVVDATGINQVVGQYLPESLYHVQLAFDRGAVEWSASINGTPVYHGPADGTDMDRFRIGMTTGDSVTPAVAFVDNVRVTADVPEPGTVCLLAIAMAGVAFLAIHRRRRSSLWAMLIVIAIVFPGTGISSADAATVTFPSATPTCSTSLQACINAAGPGDIVEVATNNPISEDLNIEKSLTLRAAAGFSPVLDDLAAVVLSNPATLSNSIVFEGFRLNPGFVRAAQRSSQPFDLRVRNNTFTDTFNDHPAIELDTGLNGPYGAVSFDISDNAVTIPDAFFAINAIFVNGGLASKFQGTIRNNKFVDLAGGQGAAILVANNSSELKVDVVGNHISGTNYNNGVFVHQFGEGSADVRVINNLVEGQVDDAGRPGAVAIAVSQGNANFVVANNTLVNSENGISIGGAQFGATWQGVVANNIVANISEFGISIDNPSAAVVNDHNLVFNTGGNNFTPGPGTLIVDPAFVGSGDYGLMLGSPAQDVGNNARVPVDVLTDIDGHQRIQGAAVDLGAYEVSVPEPSLIAMLLPSVAVTLRRPSRRVS